jgi:hypothetical protein
MSAAIRTIRVSEKVATGGTGAPHNVWATYPHLPYRSVSILMDLKGRLKLTSHGSLAKASDDAPMTLHCTPAPFPDAQGGLDNKE